MGSVLRAAAVYFFLLIVFRIAGKRSLAQLAPFDFVLLLIISETIQQAMIDTDNSWINAAILVLTLVGLSILLSVVKERVPWLERLMGGTPLILIENGKIHEDRMTIMRIDEADIIAAARAQEGIERIDQIKHAIVETGGNITIIPKKQDAG
ncbi:MAG: DUF421 domain-containing protein [Nitrososphaerales archaeon]